MSTDLLDVLKLDTGCDCGCENCRRQKDALVAGMVSLARSKRTTLSERWSGPASPTAAIGQGSEAAAQRRPRGQQLGEPGHGRRRYDHLLVSEEVVLAPPPEDLVCTECGLPYEEMSKGSSDEIEVGLVVRRRRTRRPAYGPRCRCQPRALVQAPAPPKLIPKGLLTVNTVAWLLIWKFELATPVQRITGMLALSGLDLAPGTVAGVFEQVTPLLEALASRIREHTASADQLHTDETGWRLLGLAREEWGRKFAWIWILVAADSVSYLVAESRSTAVLIEHLRLDPERPKLDPERSLILHCDRYSANLSLLRRCPDILGAICWAHVRRDFWELRGHPRLGEWAGQWLERIGALYHAHQLWNRCPEPDDSAPEQQLREGVGKTLGEIERALRQELALASLEPAARKVLISLDLHWPGLTVSTELRGVALDNNLAERGLRTPVILERNCLGSASLWSTRLAAACWTVLGTAKLTGWNLHRYLADYLDSCRLAAGVPADLDRFLPWSASPTERQRWRGALEPDSS